jgi:type IV fimbrial biogenesis protein FimT
MNLKSTFGVTVIELLITITIVSILCASLPVATGMIAQHRLNSSQSDLHLLIAKARNEALTLSTRVTVCALSDDNRCKAKWTGGISAFTDTNGNRVLDPEDNLLNLIDMPSKVITAWQGMKPTNSIHFSSTGGTFVSNGTFTLCHPGLEESRQLIINRQGRTRSARKAQACPAKAAF